MEKLLIYHLLQGNVKAIDINLEWLENPLAFHIVKLYQKATRRGDTITESDLESILKSSLGNSEFLKCQAYLSTVRNLDTELTIDDVLHSIKVTHALTRVEGTVSEIAEAAMSKDLGLLADKTKELSQVVGGTTQKKARRMGDDIDNNIFMLPSCLTTLNSTGNRLCGVTIVGAPPGTGKSAYAAQECIHNWKNGRSSVYFSLELPAKLLEARLLSNLCEVNIGDILKDLMPEDIRTPLSPENKAKLDKGRFELASEDTPDIFIFDDVFDPKEIENLIREYNTNYNVELFVLDYLNLTNSRASSDGSTWQSKALFVRDLNQLCLELGIVVILPTQIEIEKATDGTLSMKTRGTSELLNTASLALLIYRPPDVEGMLELVVTKARNAIKCSIGLEDRLDIQTFVDLGRIA
jgi:replicative DNA helicase